MINGEGSLVNKATISSRLCCPLSLSSVSQMRFSVKRQGLDISFYELWLLQKLSLNLSMLAAWIALGNLFYLTSKTKLKRGLLRPIWFNVDQIWQNFATLAVFEGLIVLDNFYAYFGNFCKVLGKVFIVRNGQIWPSGHTVRINQFLAQPNLNLENKYFVRFSQNKKKIKFAINLASIFNFENQLEHISWRERFIMSVPDIWYPKYPFLTSS